MKEQTLPERDIPAAVTGEDAVEQYGNTVYRLAFARTGSRIDADDIYQEVFLRYLKKPRSFRSEEHRKAWFIRVTLNCCKNLWASSRRQNTEPLHEAEAFAAEEDSALYLELAALPQKDREVLHLFYYEDLSTKEIAGLLRRRESTVRSQLTRARQRLKIQLEGAD